MKKIFIITSLICTSLFMSVSMYAASITDTNTVFFDAKGGQYTHQYTKEFAAALDTKDPMSLLFIGDSTGNGDTEWVYLTSQYLVDNIDEYSINYRLFDDTTKSYNRIDYLQEGLDGDAYALLDGSAGSYIKTADSDELDIVGDIDISVKVAIDNYDAVGTKALVDKLGLSGNRSFNFFVDENKKLNLWWSANGTDLILETSTVAATVDNGEAIWFRATLDVDNEAGGYDLDFYTSVDGSTWIQLGATVTGAATTAINANTQDLAFGTRLTATDLWAGKYYEAVIKDGIGSSGKIVASMDLGNAIADVAEFEDVEKNTYTVLGNVETGFGSPSFTILNASVAGKGMNYFLEPINLDQINTLDPEMTFISLGHNEGLADDIKISYNSLINSVKSTNEDTNFVLVTQNPQIAPLTVAEINAHAIRQQQIGVIASENKLGYIDAFEALSADTAISISVDGVHPTEAGSILWKNEAVKFLQGAFTKGIDTYHIEVEDGKTIVLPDDPINIGYTFDGWYTNESLTQKFSVDNALITQDITLYAKWSVGTSTSPIVPVESSISSTTWILLALGVVVVGYILYKKK